MTGDDILNVVIAIAIGVALALLLGAWADRRPMDPCASRYAPACPTHTTTGGTH